MYQQVPKDTIMPKISTQKKELTWRGWNGMVLFWPEVQLWKYQRRLESFPETSLRYLIWDQCEKEHIRPVQKPTNTKTQFLKIRTGTCGPHPRAEAPPPSRSASSQLPQLFPACVLFNLWICIKISIYLILASFNLHWRFSLVFMHQNYTNPPQTETM